MAVKSFIGPCCIAKGVKCWKKTSCNLLALVSLNDIKLVYEIHIPFQWRPLYYMIITWLFAESKFLTLPANIRLGCKWPAVTSMGLYSIGPAWTRLMLASTVIQWQKELLERKKDFYWLFLNEQANSIREALLKGKAKYSWPPCSRGRLSTVDLLVVG